MAVVKVHARVIAIGSDEGISGTGYPYAEFESFGARPGFRVPLTQEQAQQLGPHLYRWRNVTIEPTEPDGDDEPPAEPPAKE